MFHYGIKVLEVQQGMKSYHTVKQFSTQQIGEVKAMIERKEVLGLWLSKTRDLNKLKQWQEQIYKDQEKLVAAGVVHELYVKEDNDAWYPVKDLASLLRQDYEQLAVLLEREEQATLAWKRYRDRQDQDNALDEIIALMPKEMQAALYADEDDHRAFAYMMQSLIPSVDTSEARMLSYELHSHVKRQTMLKNVFMRSAPTPEPAAINETEAATPTLTEVNTEELATPTSHQTENHTEQTAIAADMDTPIQPLAAVLPDTVITEAQAEEKKPFTMPKEIDNPATHEKVSLWAKLWSKLSGRR